MILKGQNREGASEPLLYGLVLAGGKSVRMGNDKSVMQWHGKEQRYYMADMLADVCDDLYISCREEQQGELDSSYKTITDNWEGAGPLIGILSAFSANENVAWLVVACDLPLMDRDALQYLIAHRNLAGMATTFQSPHDGLPEPLITIWEPSAFGLLKQHIADGFKCPRKALIRNEQLVKVLLPPDEQALMNANTPEDAARVSAILGSA